MRTEDAIELGTEDRARFEELIEAPSTPQKHVWRARIVLLTADGLGVSVIARRTAKSRPTVRRWQARFMEEGVNGLLYDKTRPPGKAPLPLEVVQRVIEMTLKKPPPDASHWSGRAMAKAAGISLSSVQRIWRGHGFKPHLTRTFKLSNDPRFAEKVRGRIFCCPVTL